MFYCSNKNCDIVSIMKEKTVWEEVGTLSDERQEEIVYGAVVELKKQLDRGASHEEIQNYCNKMYGPYIKFNKTQTSRILHHLEDEKKKIKCAYAVVDGVERLMFSPVE